MTGASKILSNWMEQVDTNGLNPFAFGRPGSNPGFDTKFALVMELPDMLLLESSARDGVGVEVSPGAPILNQEAERTP